jgi:alpha-1,3-rhamnosyl/mannosyltransferase
LKSFADLHHRRPETFLVVSIDESEDTISRDLRALIASLGLAPNVAVVGSVPGLLPALYAISSLYCTPSVLEDFGIAVQEAAACGVPAVASSRVPYAVEYLLTNEVDEEESPPLGSAPLRIGAGAIVVEPDDVAGFTRAMEKLIADETLRKKMGERALRITIPYFTWDRMVRLFFSRLGLRID